MKNWLMYFKDELIEVGVILFAVSIIMILVAGMALVDASYKARAFERVTGKKIDTFDAMFLDLRIEATVTEKPER